jgi:MFS superfamily sulfate permease-like transporter
MRPIIELLSKIPLVHLPSLALASVMLTLLLVVRRYRFPIPGPVIVVLLSVLLSWVLDFAGMGIKVVGAIPSTLPQLSFAWPLPIGLDELVVSALAVWLVSFSAGIVSARAFGAKAGYRVDAGEELQGFAAANIASGMFGGFPVTSSDSRTAINLSVGGKTRLAGLASAAVLLVILVYLNELLRLLPVPALGAILAAAALSLMDFSGLRTLWKVSRSEFTFALIGLVAPILLGVLNGVIIAIVATLSYLIYRSMSPRMVLLGRIKGEHGFHKLHRELDAKAVPGLAVCLLQGSMLFFNSDAVRRQIEEISDELPKETSWFILDAGSTPQMDSTAAATLVEIRETLAERGMRFGIADLHSQCRGLLDASGTVDAIGWEMIFDNVEDMFEAFMEHSRGKQQGKSS